MSATDSFLASVNATNDPAILKAMCFHELQLCAEQVGKTDVDGLKLLCAGLMTTMKAAQAPREATPAIAAAATVPALSASDSSRRTASNAAYLEAQRGNVAQRDFEYMCAEANRVGIGAEKASRGMTVPEVDAILATRPDMTPKDRIAFKSRIGRAVTRPPAVSHRNRKPSKNPGGVKPSLLLPLLLGDDRWRGRDL